MVVGKIAHLTLITGIIGCYIRGSSALSVVMLS